MCTYSLTFSDTLVENARRAFPTKKDITDWMQMQVERMLRQVAVEQGTELKQLKNMTVSDRIKSLSAVPPSYSKTDYKDENVSVMSEKYLL